MSTPTTTVKPLFSPSARLENVKPYLLAAVFAARMTSDPHRVQTPSLC
jgi:hypothetical protein